MIFGKVIFGIVVGVAASAAVRSWVRSANETDATREKISKKKEDYADVIKDKFNGFVDNVSSKFEKVIGNVSDAANAGKAKVEETEKDLKAAMS